MKQILNSDDHMIAKRKSALYRRGRINLLGVPMDNMTLKETLDVVKDAIENNFHIHHTVVNAGKVVMMKENAELFRSVSCADIINVDGAGIVLASRILNNPVMERVCGIDLMESIIKMAARFKYKIYLLGATREVVYELSRKIDNMYGPGLIAGSRDGYFKESEGLLIAQEIVASKAQILFVGIPSPLKENFLFKYDSILNEVNFTMGVGGSFDVLAGKVRRAPKWMQRNSLEWLFRVYQEPSRLFLRYLTGNFKFTGLVMEFWLRNIFRKQHQE